MEFRQGGKPLLGGAHLSDGGELLRHRMQTRKASRSFFGARRD
jgi:hypothetical protein